MPDDHERDLALETAERLLRASERAEDPRRKKGLADESVPYFLKDIAHSLRRSPENRSEK